MRMLNKITQAQEKANPQLIERQKETLVPLKYKFNITKSAQDYMRKNNIVVNKRSATLIVDFKNLKDKDDAPVKIGLGYFELKSVSIYYYKEKLHFEVKFKYNESVHLVFDGMKCVDVNDNNYAWFNIKNS